MRAISFAGNTIDRVQAIEWRNWTIGFGAQPPFSKFTEQATAVHGLTCAHATIGKIGCYLYMAMKPFESFAHSCKILPENRHASGKWPLRINCPTEIDYEK